MTPFTAFAVLISLLAISGPSPYANAETLRNLVDNNDEENGGDIVFDYDADASFDEEYSINENEYQALVSYRQKIVEFWTPRKMKHAKPRHLTLNENITDAEIAKELARAAAGHDQDGGERKRGLRNLQSVSNLPWTAGGKVLEATGRLMFHMGSENYRCSATAVTDGDWYDGRSMIITAAHCVFDDANSAVSSFVLFPLFFLLLYSET